MDHLLSLADIPPKVFATLLKRATHIKKNQKQYARKLYEKTLLTMFEAPSLRTRISFEVAMTQLHGGTINFQTDRSPWGMGKESIEDVARTISQYCDLVAARIYSHKELVTLAKYASVPVINMMTNDGHPCQILGDFLTIQENIKQKKFKIAYLGDAKNNVTYSLMRACAITGNTLAIACPTKKAYYPEKHFITEAQKLARKYKGKITITKTARDAVKNADIVYTDSWMSYRIPPKEKKQRSKDLKPYQVTPAIMKQAKKTAKFMHCLPATRGHEVTASVIDGKQSIVFTQAQNRLHIQKAVLLTLAGK